MSLFKKKMSDDMNNYHCSSCEEDHVSTEADVYCELCVKFYCLKCINLHSQLFKKHSTHGRDEMDKWPASKGTLAFIETCEVHRDEKLKVLCEDHRQLCCSNCVMMAHRQCTKLTLISEAANIPTKADFNNVSAKVQQILTEIKELQRSRQNNIESIQTSHTERLHQLREIRNKINVQIDELEKATVKELDDLKTKLNDSFKADVETCSMFEAELKSLSEALHVAKNKSSELAFIAYSKCMYGINRVETHLHEISELKEFSITFQVNSDIERYLSSLSGLGSISSNQCLIVVERKKVYLDPFEKPDVKAICDFPNGHCLIAMLNTMKVVLVDPNYKVLSQCHLSARPQNMCQISTCQAAVAVEDWSTIHQIQFISENKGKLVKDRKIELYHACAGLAHHHGDIYVTSKTALYRYTINGKQMTKLYEDTSGGTTVCKCAVNPTGDIIYVTNRTKHTLLTLSREGTILSTFQDPELKMPFAIHVTALAQVLLCCVNSKTVIQVDGTGRRKVATLASEKEGLFKPMSVYYSKNTNAIIVGQAECDYILILKVK